jgi:hypothetical protein
MTKLTDGKIEAELQSVQEPVAKKLIGWRTENFLWETSDADKAMNWEPNIGVLPIFEGDPNTSLVAAPIVQPASVCGEPETSGVHRTDGPCYQPVQEPVGIVYAIVYASEEKSPGHGRHFSWLTNPADIPPNTKLYTAPAAALRAELSALKAGDVVMVPREPTEEMLHKAFVACVGIGFSVPTLVREETYRAMIAAAPGVQGGNK